MHDSQMQFMPWKESLEAYLQDSILKRANWNAFKHVSVSDDSGTSDSDDESEDQQVLYKQWTTVDRSELNTYSATASEFVSILCDKLNDLTAHSYVARSQAAYLKHLKESIQEDDVIVLGDFAENFKFVIQDEIQSYHWNQQQCTLHPIVMYYKCTNESQLSMRSICFVSDDLNHDVNLVYKIVSYTVSIVKEELCLGVNKIYYMLSCREASSDSFPGHELHL